MGLISSIKNLFFKGSTYHHPDDRFFKSITTFETDSGIRVDSEKALTLSWVWQAVNIIANDVGKLPLILYDRRNPDDRRRAIAHPAYNLVKRRPNAFMSAKTFRATLTAHALLRGNGLALIVRDGRGVPLELLPLNPNKTRVEFNGSTPFYITKFGDDPADVTLAATDVLHIKGLGFDGIWGYDVITLARNSFGLGLATEKHGARYYKNNARPSVVLETDASIDKEQAEQILASWSDMHRGVENAHETALLSGGMKANAISMSNENAQWIESRKFQRSDVASWFCLPPHKLGDSDKASYSSLEQENRSYIDNTLTNWLSAWEDECNEKLLGLNARVTGSHEFEFLTASLLRADLKTRYESYSIGIVNEFLSPNEVRRLENMPARTDEDGDSFRNPNTRGAEAEADPEAEPEAEPVDNPGGDEETEPVDIAAHKQLIVDRLRHMMGVERQRVKKATTTAGNFINWADNFYANFADTLANALRPCLAVCQNVSTSAKAYTADTLARLHVEESQRRLLDVAGDSFADTLAANVQREVETWNTRATDLADQLFRENLNQ